MCMSSCDLLDYPREHHYANNDTALGLAETEKYILHKFVHTGVIALP